MAKLIAFDLDGTLIDSRLDLAGAVNYMRCSMGLEPLETERVVHFVGNGAAALVRRAIADAEIDFDEALHRMRAFYFDHITDTTVLYPGVAAGLKQLREAGNTLAVVTNKPTSNAMQILQELECVHSFDRIWGGDSGFPLKPDPAALLAFQKQWGAPAEKCWMAGDHYTDLGAGRQAGFKRAFCRWGFGNPGDESFDQEFNTFAEFTAAVMEQ
jgi:phosphoglycolate phosphatase